MTELNVDPTRCDHLPCAPNTGPEKPVATGRPGVCGVPAVWAACSAMCANPDFVTVTGV